MYLELTLSLVSLFNYSLFFSRKSTSLTFTKSNIELPTELVYKIVSYLPANGKINCMRTCSIFQSLLSPLSPEKIFNESIPMEQHFYLKAMVFYGKRADKKSLQLLIDNEGEENRIVKEKLLKYFPPEKNKNISDIISICQSPNQPQDWGNSALYIAVSNEDIEITNILLNYLDSDQNQKNAYNTRVIDVIFREKYEGGLNLRKNMINLFLNHPQCQPNQCEGSHNPILFNAVLNNRIDDVKLLLENSKIDPNTISQGCTALYYALDGRTEIAKLLINDRRTDLNITYNDHYHHCNETFLMRAIELMRETDILTHLASNPRCDPNLQDNNGNTALHHAARYPLAAKALLETSYHPIDLKIKNKQDYTAIDEIKRYAFLTRNDNNKQLYKKIFEIISKYQKILDLQKNNSITYAKPIIALYNTLSHIFQIIKNALTVVFAFPLY